MIEGQVHTLQEGQGTAFTFNPDRASTHYATYLAKQSEQKKQEADKRRGELGQASKELNSANVYLNDRQQYAKLAKQWQLDAAKLISQGKDPFSGVDEESISMLERKMDLMNLAQISADRAKIAEDYAAVRKSTELGKYTDESLNEMNTFLSTNLSELSGKELTKPLLRLKDPLKEYTTSMTDMLGQISKATGERPTEESIEAFIDQWVETAPQVNDGSWAGVVQKFDQLSVEMFDNLTEVSGGRRQPIAQMVIDDLKSFLKPPEPINITQLFNDLEQKAVSGASSYDTPESSGTYGQLPRYRTSVKETWEVLKNSPTKLRELQALYGTKDTQEIEKRFMKDAKEREPNLSKKSTTKGDKKASPVKRKDWISRVQRNDSEALSYIVNSDMFGTKISSAKTDSAGIVTLSLIKLNKASDGSELTIPGLNNPQQGVETKQLNEQTFEVKIDSRKQQSLLNNMYNDVHKKVKREWDEGVNTVVDEFLPATIEEENEFR